MKIKYLIFETLQTVFMCCLFFSLCTVLIKRHNWWEDGRGANVKTSAWQPNRVYETSIEEA